MAYTFLYTSVAAIQAKTGLTNAEVDLTNDDIVRAVGEDAEKELEMLTGRKFTSGNADTEYLSTRGKDVTDNFQRTVVVTHFPIQSVVTFNLLDLDGNAISTFDPLTTAQIAAGDFDTAQYWLELLNDPLTNVAAPTGKFILKVQTIAEGTNTVKLAYTYGYSAVPSVIRDLATCLAGVRCWLRFLGASYNRLNDYSIPQQTVSKGDFYQRGKQNIAMLTEEAERLLDRIGRKPRTLFFASGGAR